MSRLKHIVKHFVFKEDNRPRITLGPEVRLHPTLHHLQLKQGSGTGGGYPTTADLYAKTWTTTPRSMKRWVGFMADVKHFKNRAGTQLTDVRYRLSADGVNELYWNSGANAWVPAAPNNWNTEAEVANNIAAFPASTQTIQVVLNLKTDDASVTPEVRALRLLYESDLEELEDYVWRSLLPSMRSQIRPIGEHAIEMAAAGASIDLNTYPIETPYDIVGIDAVYDIDADPRKLTNLFDSYNDATKVIALTGAIPGGNTALIRFLYAPVLAVTTHQDYIELEKVPEILLEDVKIVDDLGKSNGAHYVINKATGAGKKVPVTQGDIEIRGRYITDKAKDHARLSDAVRRYFEANQLLRSVGMDDDFRLWLIDFYDQDTTPNQDDLHAGRFLFRIAQAVFFDNDAVDITGVLNFNLALTKALC